MDIDTLIAELRTELSGISQLGQIDDLSVYRWVRDELRRFGGTVTAHYEDMVETKGGMAMLPDNFFGLLLAVKCEPLGYECDAPPEKRAILQNSLFWKERIEYGKQWNSCQACCEEAFDKTIVENVYINEIPIKFHYHRPVMLKLAAGATVPNACLSACRNRAVRDCPWEISISGRTLYANFDGNIYIRYQGVLQDSEGKPVIPETDLQLVQKYIENYVKMKIFEKIAMNSEDASGINKFKLYLDICTQSFTAAMTDAKMSRYDWSMYKAMYMKNRGFALHFELPFMR